MKKIFLVIILFFTLGNVLGQDELPEIFPRDENGKIIFTEVVQVDSTLNQSQLFGNAKLFFANTFKSAKDVIQLEDKENGRIVGKGLSNIYITVLTPVKMKLHYSILIECKDGRYKYTIYDLYYEDYPDKYNSYRTSKTPIENTFETKRYYNRKGQPKSLFKQYKEKTEAEIENLVKLIKESMETSGSKTSDSDW